MRANWGPAGGAAGGPPTHRMAGLRVGVTAGRRGDELVEALTRLGASVVWGPTVEVVPATAAALARQTAAVLAARPAWVMVTTAEGLDRWVDGARERRAAILALLAGTTVAARGAKATAACRRHGLPSVLTSPTELGVDLARLVVALAKPGDRVAVVVDGSGSRLVVAELQAAGLAVDLAAPYRWTVPAATAPAGERCVPAGDLVRALCAGEIDAMAFTSPPAVEGLFAVAAALGLETVLREALSGTGQERVLVAAIGPATAEALEERRVGVGVCPLQPRMVALAGALAAAPLGFSSFGRPEPLVLDPLTRTVTAGRGGGAERPAVHAPGLDGPPARDDLPHQRAAAGGVGRGGLLRGGRPAPSRGPGLPAAGAAGVDRRQHRPRAEAGLPPRTHRATLRRVVPFGRGPAGQLSYRAVTTTRRVRQWATSGAATSSPP